MNVLATRAAFRAACATFVNQIEDIEKDGNDFQTRVDADEAQWSEVDEDTGIGFDYGDELAERRFEAEEALSTLRKAFAILAYHQWERGALSWAKYEKKRPNHGDYVSALTTSGIQVDINGLADLNRIVNCLKHNNGKSGAELHSARPDLFDPSFDPSALHPVTGKPLSHIKWEENLKLTDENVEEFFRTILNSAPR
ncbi:hypothetical protein X727_12480 [Mesorhizobium sp. L103C119B0]|nr:hypothetical protein X727_12480 [Mesorhizobium sp. L103C119B0]